MRPVFARSDVWRPAFDVRVGSGNKNAVARAMVVIWREGFLGKSALALRCVASNANRPAVRCGCGSGLQVRWLGTLLWLRLVATLGGAPNHHHRSRNKHFACRRHADIKRRSPNIASSKHRSHHHRLNPSPSLPPLSAIRASRPPLYNGICA